LTRNLVLLLASIGESELTLDLPLLGLGVLRELTFDATARAGHDKTALVLSGDPFNAIDIFPLTIELRNVLRAWRWWRRRWTSAVSWVTVVRAVSTVTVVSIEDLSCRGRCGVSTASLVETQSPIVHQHGASHVTPSGRVVLTSIVVETVEVSGVNAGEVVVDTIIREGMAVLVSRGSENVVVCVEINGLTNGPLLRDCVVVDVLEQSSIVGMNNDTILIGREVTVCTERGHKGAKINGLPSQGQCVWLTVCNVDGARVVLPVHELVGIDQVHHDRLVS